MTLYSTPETKLHALAVSSKYCVKNTEDVSHKIDRQLVSFFDEYKRTKSPIEVNFRDLVDWVPYSDSYTHYIHSYPAKLIKHIPIFFLNSHIFLPEKKSLVLDPFCGSGTVLLESLLAGHNSIGCDANPLARLIAKVKTISLDIGSLEIKKSQILSKAKRLRKAISLNVINVDHWYPKKTQLQLSKLYRAIHELTCDDEYNFFIATFSSLVKKVSYSDPNLSVPVKLKPEKYKNIELKCKVEKRIKSVENMNVYDLFEKHVDKNIKRISKLNDNRPREVKAEVISKDARVITKSIDRGSGLLESESVDFIITSPPYAGAQKYIRSSSLSLGWVGFCENKSLRDYEKVNIGREHYAKSEYQELETLNIPEIDTFLQMIKNDSPLRAHINGNYLKEMESAIEEMFRVLKSNRFCVIVIGNNEVCGKKFETQKYIRLLAERIGFSTQLVLVDEIHSRGLMTKRNKTASIINSEWILVLKK
jgi:DNA modification methylase